MSSPASVMVSEPRRGSYAAAVIGSGKSSQGTHPASPINRSPTRPSPMSNPQRINNPQRNNDKAEQMWNDLRKRFSQRDPHRISSLQNEIYLLKQGSSSVNDYYTRCRILWEQMNELRPLPVCRCDPRCSCSLLEEIRTEREIDQIIRFLQGLNEGYNSLKSSVLELDPLPDMHKIFVMAEKFEKQLNIANMNLTGIELSHATAAVTLIPKFNEAESEKESKYYPNTHINSVSLHSFSWILDSGATDHIACSLDSFDDYYVVEGTMVNLQNGKHIRVEHMGNITLGDGICLKNVLHIPSFKFNIISVSKLLNNSPHLLTFTNDQCILRGSHGRTVGFAKEENGLYLLLEPPQITVNSCKLSAMSCTAKTWHQRLGHFPMNKMSLVCDISVPHNKNFACDVCHYAKHKRSCFP
ncbi:PREDICTED: uncharacterized protein LOC109163044 [Ipomoea nil]|uniref:uncharacterized protein LOC109163044 n=1 Tax=Ipomoea nil TaxID=35883 RepID=UPI00090168D6|nr:PREDICTED: uncharacterized protein LOC109163044 [Ipomoea nil]